MRRETLGKSPASDRLFFLKWGMIIVVAVIISRLAFIQTTQHPLYAALAQEQYDVFKKLFPERGRIFVTDRVTNTLYPVAINDELYEIYSVPRRIKNPDAVAKALSPVLEMTEDEIRNMISNKDETYHLLKRKVTRDVRDTIIGLNLKGIGAQSEVSRYYPEKSAFAHVTGFLGFQGDRRVGQYGIEGAENDALAGQQGYINDFFAIQRGDEKGFQEAQDGSDIVLTVDRTVQFTACTKLREAVIKHGGTSGTLIVMNPQTGEIIAMCSYPDFDPNEYQKAEDASVYNNTSVFQSYEPGSTFKAITMAAALDAGKIQPSTTYVDTGSVKIGGFTIRNADGKVYGLQNMTQVLENSVNTGAMFAAGKIGNQAFENVVKELGFGQKTGIEVSGESTGNITPLAKHKDIYTATASYGQGITVTPIQMVTAYAALANGGFLVKPTIIKEIRKPDGQIIKPQVTERRQIFSERTSLLISAMLGSVVENGHGKRAGVPGYFVAGKTGTAQVAKEKGAGYDPDKSIGSFIGYAPIDNPAFVMLAKVDNPKDVQFAESTAAPLFGEMADFLLQYMKVPPTREK